MLRVFLFLVILSLAPFVSCQDIDRYEMYSDHFDIDNYAAAYNRSFDSTGIILQKGQYHPLTISIYGVLNYDKFIETGDSLFYQRIINQFKYFNDSSRWDVAFDDKGIGLPYHFKFHDLKPKWYSGLSQGMAVSFMVRYYKLTNDPLAKEYAKKIGYFMNQPVENGGAISRTPENKLWIEEYPNTKRSKHVLNGFINGLVGLKEYCDFFPEDTIAVQLHDSVYASFISSVGYYDTNNWTCYDRNKKRVSNLYMRIQLTQLRHLYSIYNDEEILTQLMIWSKMMDAKLDKELKFYLKPAYSFGVQKARYDIDSTLFEYSFNSPKALKVSGKLIEGQFKLKRKNHIGLINSSYDIQITLEGNKLEKLKISGFDDKDEFTPIEYIYRDSVLIIHSKKLLKSIEINERLFHKKKVVKALKQFEPREFNAPLFMINNYGKQLTLNVGDTVKLNIQGDYIDQSKLFYRTGLTTHVLKAAIWDKDNVLSFQQGYFIVPTTGVYEFFLSSQIRSKRCELVKFEILPDSK